MMIFPFPILTGGAGGKSKRSRVEKIGEVAYIAGLTIAFLGICATAVGFVVAGHDGAAMMVPIAFAGLGISVAVAVVAVWRDVLRD